MPLETQPPCRATPNIPALTGLRGAGAVWVFLHHFNLFQFGTGNGMHALAVGFAGVDLFFLLSGFVLCHSRWHDFCPPAWRAYARFMAERVTRLYPTNAAVLLIFAVAAASFPGVWWHRPAADSSALSLATSLLLVQSWLPFPGGGWNGPGWSVSAEMGAYAALPLLLLGLRRITSARLALLLACAVLLAFVAILTLAGVHDLNVSVRGGLLRLTCEFTTGGLLCTAWRGGLRLPVGLSTATVVVCLSVALGVHRAEVNFLMLPAFALTVLLAAQNEGFLVRILTSRLMLFLGRISYSLYLVHWPVLMFWSYATGLPRGALGFLADATMVPTTIALATVLHFLVEAPSHRWARALGQTTPGLFVSNNEALS